MFGVGVSLSLIPARGSSSLLSAVGFSAEHPRGKLIHLFVPQKGETILPQFSATASLSLSAPKPAQGFRVAAFSLFLWCLLS